MGRLIYLIFIAPWWLYTAAAAGFLYLSEEVYQNELRDQADAQAALAQPVPDRVDLSDFDRLSDVGLADEVHIGGWINTDFNYHLRKTKKGSVRAEGYMYVLQGTRDSSGTKEVRAILLMSEQEKADFISRINEFQVPGTASETGRLYFGFNGVRSSEGAFSDLVKDAFKEQGLTKGPNFIVVEPFWEGREKGLAYTRDPERLRVKLWQLSGVLLALAAIKFGLARRRKRVKRSQTGNGAEQDIFANSPIVSGHEKAVRRNSQQRAEFQPPLQPRPAEAERNRFPELSRAEQQPAARSPGPGRPSLLQRFAMASGKSKLILAALASVLPLCILMPSLAGMLIPLGFVVYIYMSIGMKAASAVRGAMEEVGLLKPKAGAFAKQDPFSRLQGQAKDAG